MPVASLKTPREYLRILVTNDGSPPRLLHSIVDANRTIKALVENGYSVSVQHDNPKTRPTVKWWGGTIGKKKTTMGTYRTPRGDRFVALAEHPIEFVRETDPHTSLRGGVFHYEPERLSHQVLMLEAADTVDDKTSLLAHIIAEPAAERRARGIRKKSDYQALLNQFGLEPQE